MSRDQEALVDILESIRLILQYAADQDLATLATNMEKQDAILRRITIIGEATKRLSHEFRLQYPAIPWKQMAGMRDVITHNYDEVDLDEVWVVIQQNLPQLLAAIEPLIPSEPS